MTRLAACATFLLSALYAGAVAAQPITMEAAVTGGHSSEEAASAAATQLRAFGDVGPRIHVYAEAAWGTTTDDDVDAFGAAYPYHNRPQIVETYAERMFRPRGAILGIKGGRYRMPFGIYAASDQSYNGFLRPPLMRYDGYFSISNNFLEQGADLIAGVPRFTVEAAVGAPADIGSVHRRSGVDTVARAQAYAGPFIAGVSYVRTEPYQSPIFAHGQAEFGGFDLRFSYAGVELRGELIDGRPFNGTKTVGWYADAMVHRVGMGPVTLLARVEDIAYETAPPFNMHGRRQTVGARVRILQPLAFQVNAVHQSGEPAEYGAAALDVALTNTVRR